MYNGNALRALPIFFLGGSNVWNRWKKAVEGARSGLYAIYDRVAEEAGPCFIAVNDGVAVRYYRQLIEKNGVVSQTNTCCIVSGRMTPRRWK